MSQFDDRERAFETKFARDEEMQFRIIARRNRLLGEWAARLMGLTEAEAESLCQGRRPRRFRGSRRRGRHPQGARRPHRGRGRMRRGQDPRGARPQDGRGAPPDHRSSRTDGDGRGRDRGDDPSPRFPMREVEIRDLAGDGDHYAARVVSAAFAGMSRVRQHQAVYAALEGQDGDRAARAAARNRRAIGRSSMTDVNAAHRELVKAMTWCCS